ncbi:MAG: hypothetical protein IJA99_07060 [Oscillospiraceae bacterium]|nr:hypothetical protein [Oscillospiraceae bacterium]
MKNTRSRFTRLTSFFLCLVLTVSLLPVAAFADPVSVTYRDLNGDIQTVSATVLSTGSYNYTFTEGWYLIRGSFSTNKNYIQGNVNLILEDGCLWDVQRIEVTQGNSVTFWGQSAGTGKLVIDRDDSYPGIGAIDKNVGSITFNGGIVKTDGVPYAVAIGGQTTAAHTNNDGLPTHCGQITINGGYLTVSASGDRAAIGGGSGSGGSVTINGGTLNLSSGDEALAAIDAPGMTPTVNGGSIKGYGSELILAGTTDGTPVTAIAGSSYSLRDVMTIGDKLYLPESVASALTSVTAGGTTYLFGGSFLVQSSDLLTPPANRFTLSAKGSSQTVTLPGGASQTVSVRMGIPAGVTATAEAYGDRVYAKETFSLNADGSFHTAVSLVDGKLPLDPQSRFPVVRIIDSFTGQIVEDITFQISGETFENPYFPGSYVDKTVVCTTDADAPLGYTHPTIGYMDLTGGLLADTEYKLNAPTKEGYALCGDLTFQLNKDGTVKTLSGSGASLKDGAIEIAATRTGTTAIALKNPADATLSYNGAEQKPAVTVTYNGVEQDLSAYTIVYTDSEGGSDLVNAGTKTVSIQGTGISCTYQILPIDRSDTPTVSAVGETVDQKADGKITGTDDTMEYRADGQTGYTAVSGSEITDLAPGNYFVRYKATTNYKPSDDTEVTVPAGRKLTVTLPAASEQIGYTLSASASQLSWNEDLTLTFALADGYSATADFAVKHNGTPVSLTGGTATLADLQQDAVLTVEGVADITPPTVSIRMETNEWKDFFNSVSFGIFFKETKEITISAADVNTGSGLSSIEYYITDTALTLEQLRSHTAWIGYNGTFSISGDNEYIIYAKATDHAGNAVYANNEKILVYDSVAPSVYGVADGESYYGTTKITITEEYLHKVLLDGADLTLDSSNSALLPADGTEHTLTVSDKAESSVELRFTLLTIDSVDDSIAHLTPDNVTSDDRASIGQVKALAETLSADSGDYTAAETAQLRDILAACDALLQKLDAVSDAVSTEKTEQVKDITEDNVKNEDKGDLQQAKTDLEAALSDHSGNLTDEEKDALQSQIDQIDKALTAIENAETVRETIEALPDTITKQEGDAIDAAKEAYCALTGREKILVGETARTKLDRAVRILEKLLYPVEEDDYYWSWSESQKKAEEKQNPSTGA